MAGDMVMLHGASAGAWCFETFREVFEREGWSCHAPELVGHGEDAAEAKTRLVGVGMADYRAALAKFIGALSRPPVLLGHSMGAVLAQQLAAAGMARALILVSPAPRAGILPAADSEKQLAQGVMTIPSFWARTISPDFDLACFYSLNCLPAGERRAVFDRFGPESGRVYLELFFWMFDQTRASAVDADAVSCPVLCISGADDNLISLATARETAAPYRDATFWAEAGRGHMLPVEPGAADLARRIAAWIAAKAATA